MFSKTFFIYLVLLAMILLGTKYTLQQIIYGTHTFNDRYRPDVYASEVTIFHIDPTGKCYNQLKSPLLIHYPSDDNILLRKPVFDLFLQNHEIWVLSAQYGKLKADHDHLKLWQDVKVIQKKGRKETIASMLTTSSLNIDLKKKFAHTADPVTINQTQQIFDGIGLHADFDSKSIRLLSQVKGTLKPIKN